MVLYHIISYYIMFLSSYPCSPPRKHCHLTPTRARSPRKCRARMGQRRAGPEDGHHNDTTAIGRSPRRQGRTFSTSNALPTGRTGHTVLLDSLRRHRLQDGHRNDTAAVMIAIPFDFSPIGSVIVHCGTSSCRRRVSERWERRKTWANAASRGQNITHQKLQK